MRYVTGILGGMFVFVGVWLIAGLILCVVLPQSLVAAEVGIGWLRGNVPSVIGMVLGGLAATHTFKASLNAKTGKLYGKEKDR